jgi:hypothetical protein
MLRDIEFASEERISVSKQIFVEQKIPCATFPVEPVKLIPMTFHDRIPSISREASRYIFYQLQRNHWLNHGNYLMYNPRRKLAWQTFLFPASNGDIKIAELANSLNANKNNITDFLNTVYGEHEMSYERSFEALKWLKELSMSSKKSN